MPASLRRNSLPHHELNRRSPSRSPLRFIAVPVLAMLVALGGCATRPVNPPLAATDHGTGYRIETRQKITADQARELLDLVKQNPIPVGMIAVGAIWLLATARSPMLDRLKSSVTSRSDEFKLRPRSEEPAPIGPPTSGL